MDGRKTGGFPRPPGAPRRHRGDRPVFIPAAGFDMDALRHGQHLVPVRQRPGPAVHHGIAYLPILPRITLLIVGGGHVGQAVAKLAAEVDFDIWVLDDRAAYASAEWFRTP